MSKRLIALVYATILTLIGCGDDGAGKATTTPVADVGQDSSTTVDSAAEDAASADSLAELPSFDVSSLDADAVSSSDTVAPSDGSCGEPGCACTVNGTCNSGLCIEVGSGQQCAALCSSSGCPEGFKCTALTSSGGDVVNVCAPAAPRICEPCNADSDCSNVLGGADNRCVPYLSQEGALLGRFCATACSENNPCPGGFLCAATTSVGGVAGTQCIKQDLACPCDVRAVALQLATGCSQVNGNGSCGGKRTCSAAGLSACDAPLAQTETCNGVDDDCDGKTDEPTPGMCDDNLPCSYDNCVGNECQHPAKAGDCDDGSACTTADACIGVKCAGEKVNCDDNNPCTTDSCDTSSGCVHTDA